ncbi:class I histocompatibility antigen, F10 alpha chain-like isoform X2 [Rhincodon typus]|uniref:class I histocompatibility antigen, F10 alpha chain-like isoform X2 n=1 Tax=Rhincodon typus TaxID=259920 RepID=UPI00202DBE52|nr:class I histocompatibility antigen, F10 alpha chain-like isoform X2 [Rhincodon typus]
MLLIIFSISLCFSWSTENKIFTAAFIAVSGTTDLPEYFGVTMINGVPVTYYDSNTCQTVSLQQWMTDSYDANYWKILTKQGNEHSDKARENLRTVMKSTNQTSGVHILQFIRTVEITADGSIKRSMNVGFDGKDFISLESDRMRWVASNHFAVKIKEEWDSDKAWNKHWKWHLEEELVERLKSRLHFGRQYFGRRVQPEVFISRSEPNRQDKPLTLSCLVTGFYPVDIEVTWLRNGEVMSETQSSGIRPNHDGTHQIQKEIEINPGDEDQYSCQIEHSSLSEAKFYQWAHPILETRPTLLQQEVMENNVELKLMSISEPELQTQPLQRESNGPHDLEQGNNATNEKETPSETDTLNPASSVSDVNTVQHHLDSNVT